LRAPATPPDSVSVTLEKRTTLEVAKWPRVSRRIVTLMTGSGDEKLDSAAGISISDTDRAGVLDWSA
jgi:hypothetical protein